MKREQIKKEILTAISKINIVCSDFDHCIEDSQFTYAQRMYSTESKHFLIELDLTECMRWISYDDGEFYDLEVTDLRVCTQERDINIDFISDDEILNAINY